MIMNGFQELNMNKLEIKTRITANNISKAKNTQKSKWMKMNIKVKI